MLRVRPTWLVFACALTLSAAPVTLFNDLGGEPEDVGASVTDEAPLAESFSTGGSSYNLTSVVLTLSSENTGPRGSITVNLYSDSSTSPGTLLTQIGTLDDTALSSNLQNYTFTLATPYSLAANTRYWIGVTSVGGSIALWWYLDISDSLTGTGAASEFDDDAGDIRANGSGESDTFLLQVTANPAAAPPPSATPVPPSLTLTLIGVVCLGLYSMRRRSVHSS